MWLSAVADRKMTKLDAKIAQYREELKRRLPGDTGREKALVNLADSLEDRFLETNDIGDIEEAIGLHRTALTLRLEGRHKSLHNLAWCLHHWYRKQGTLPDLDEAITLGRAALDLRAEGHPDRSDSLHSLALYFSDRYDEQGSVADLEEAITLGRAALKLRPPGHSDRALTLHNFGNDLRRRFLKLGATADLDEALSLHQSALNLSTIEGRPDRYDFLHALAGCFSDRHDKQGSVADLDEAITLGRAALKHRPPGHSDCASTLYNLAIYLRNRFLKFGATADLDEAFSLHRSALDLRPEGHPDRSNSLYSLALCLGDWYDRQASVAESEEAIALGRAASELHRLRHHTDPAITCYSLGYYLRTRFLKVGTDTDLDDAILFHQLALDLRPVGHPDRLVTLNEAVSCIGLRFEKLKAPADLDDLVDLHREILDLHPPNHREHVKSVDELLFYLRKRGQKLRMTADLEECVTLGRIALGLHKRGGSNYATYFRHLVSDLQRMLRNLEKSFSNPNSLSDHMSLHNIVLCVRDVVTDGHASTNMDKIVAVMRGVLKLCPFDHSVHIASFTTLTTCLQHIFQKRDDITNLDEAIMMCKEVLERCPSGSPDSALPLHALAWCLSQRFIKFSTKSDLEDAIKFEEAASTLYLPGHPDHAESLDSLSNYLQMRIKGRDEDLLAHPASPNGSLQIKQRIRDVIFEVLKVSPPRLLYTRNGTLCDRNSQMSHFENSHEFNQLVLSGSTFDNSSTVTHIRATVSTYFRYVTLSHRWGNSEPLLRNIEGRAIYDLDPTDGLSKLQSFCLASCRQGYLWAWSDTCCIDKESSAELQEAIGSMFSWYRESALTIVHLADVSGTGALTSSVWFRRGWTLQELLAPRFLLFFTRDWSPYRGIPSDHKKNRTILGELEQATGITSRHLTDFYPSVEDARSRLQWASTRSTTRPEDISYSLFGVFGLHIPVLYGESVGNALGRLLAEVIAKSGDTSILDWVGQPSMFHSCFPATITPYQSLPSQLPDSITPPDVPSTWKFLTLRSVRKMHQALSDLPLTQFLNFRLILPCIIHRIKTIVRHRTDTGTGCYVYHFRATGLESIEITLSERLKGVSERVVPYVLIRPWHFNLLGPSVLRDSTSAQRWLTKMQQPFSALLLKELPRNEYKRAASTCHILARPTNPAGVLKGEITTLTIV